MELRLFGAVRALRGDDELNLGSVGQKALIALLALHAGRAVTVDRLVELLWEDAPPDQAVHTIRVYISLLRRILETDPTRPALLLTEEGGYRLAIDHADVDVLCFEQLASRTRTAAEKGDHAETIEFAEAALELWGEEPLTEFQRQLFAETVRRRLALMWSQLVEQWAHARLEMGTAGAVVDRLRELLAADPYREQAWQLLALALYREGRQTEALKTLREAATVLGELGLEVGPGLRELEDAIFQHDPALLVAPRPGLHNLPLPLNRFVGRHKEAEHLIKLLDRYRLVTLTGPGGSGKTRLAIEMTHTQVGRHADGVWIVDLAPVDNDQLLPAIFETLGAPLQVGSQDLGDLARHLRNRHMLLVLDNAEHLVDGVAQLAATVLQRCPGLRILATSRESLQVAGEAVYQIPPLDLPDPKAPGDEDVANSDAVALFLDRASSAGIQVERDEATLHQVAAIVHRLDGIPLAIELAAPRLAMLPISELASRIDDVFAALGRGPRTALPRHRTLRAAFDWSYQTLTRDEQQAFEALSLVRGEFDLAAACSVIGSDDADRLVGELVAKSMLTRITGPEPRYRVLEPLRQFGAERLAGAPLLEAVDRRDRHFLRVAEELSGTRTADDPVMQAMFAKQRLHLEATLDHLLAQARVDDAAAMATGLTAYWLRLGFYDQGGRLIERVLASSSPPADDVRNELLLGLAWLLVHRGDYAEGERIISIAAISGFDIEDLNWSNLKGSLKAEKGDMRSAQAHLVRGTELAQQQQSSVLPALFINLSAVTAWMGEVERSAGYASDASTAAEQMWPIQPEALLRTIEGIQARMVGDLDRADSRLEAAADTLRVARSNLHLGMTLVEHAFVSLERGDLARARELTEEALTVAVHPERGPAYTRMRCKQILARVAWEGGDFALARQFMAEIVEGPGAANTPAGLAETGDLAAEMAITERQALRASALLEATSKLRQQIGLARDAHQAEWHRRLQSRLPKPPDIDTDRLADMILELLHEEGR